MYIVEGPTKIGNVFGFYGYHVPAGRYAVVEYTEYANGGRGPATVDGELYPSRAAAEAALAKLQADERD